MSSYGGSFYIYFVIYAYITRIVIVTISMGVATLIASSLLISNVYAHGVTGKTVILNDDTSGHSKGWDPDGTKKYIYNG
jgi:hypothetical protein